MRVAFRVDASAQMGSGHLMRCLALAEALRTAGADILFICRELPGHLCSIVERCGFPLKRLPIPQGATPSPDVTPYAACLGVDWASDATETTAALTREVDWLVVDHYALDARWEKMLRSRADRILVLDDLADRCHDCDLLLDQNMRVEKAPYRGLVPPFSVVLLGPRFALLRDEFRQARTNVSVRTGAVRRVVVFFGGSDLTNETEKAISAIRLLNPADIEVDVIVGESNPMKERIAALCADLPYMHFHCQVVDMARFLAKADLALGAAGVSSWERLALGVPTLVVAVADNQVENMRQLDMLGVVVGLGVSRDVTVEGLSQAIGKLLSAPRRVNAMSEKAFGLVDGAGTERVVDFLIQGVIHEAV